ncbi:MAG: precorrin-6Y C5,15-methyltransferase (decarboxylating) subunit CbiT [Propionicimonas sp.]|uniref:precorrin-6Y C5,15-methyltransferase (decarboxylating) subunit CbiT n=1 Tax=Propionicimonas sp. TaxID=1955623 RepID=UPI003D107603
MDARSSRQLSAGLPDDAFATDGLLTKRVLRAYALAMLAPVGDEVLWDLGAGTGSIGIEWCRLHPGNTAVAVERDPERRVRIELNAAAHGVGGRVRVVPGRIRDALEDLPDPRAVFVGGGISADVLSRCWEALPSGGRLVAHSVTADSDVVLLDAYRHRGGELVRIGVENAGPIGRYVGFTPLRTVAAWAATKE